MLQCREWMKTLPDFLMSINLSYLQVVEADFVNFISEVLRETGVPCENLLLGRSV